MNKTWLSENEKNKQVKTFLVVIQTREGWDTLVLRVKNVFGIRRFLRSNKEKLLDYGLCSLEP